MFPLPRVLYAMSSDGVIFRYLARVNNWTKTPLIATILSGLLSGRYAIQTGRWVKIICKCFKNKNLLKCMCLDNFQSYHVLPYPKFETKHISIYNRPNIRWFLFFLCRRVIYFALTYNSLLQSLLYFYNYWIYIFNQEIILLF